MHKRFIVRVKGAFTLGFGLRGSGFWDFGLETLEVRDLGLGVRATIPVSGTPWPK